MIVAVQHEEKQSKADASGRSRSHEPHLWIHNASSDSKLDRCISALPRPSSNYLALKDRSELVSVIYSKHEGGSSGGKAMAQHEGVTAYNGTVVVADTRCSKA